jgi:agmatine deiminase
MCLQNVRRWLQIRSAVYAESSWAGEAVRVDLVAFLGTVAILVAGVTPGCATRDTRQISSEEFTFPAEFGPHDAVWMVWLGEPGHDRVSTQAIVAMNPFVRIELVVEEQRLVDDARHTLSAAGVDLGRLRIHVQNPTDFYYRDDGPLFLVGNRGGLKVADFSWNGYGSPPDKIDERRRGEAIIDRDIAQRLGLETVPSKAVTEGGAMEVNGRGTMLAVETLALQRNPGWSLKEIEREYVRVMGQKQLIWLKQGLADDPLRLQRIVDDYFATGTGGHIDEFARFTDAHTILLASVTREDRDQNPVSRMNDDRLEETFRRLEAATDQDGKPFTIIRVPMPPALYEIRVVDTKDLEDFKPFGVRSGDRIRRLASASYLNYFATNGVVLVPSFWRQGRSPVLRQRDQEVARLFGHLFPGRSIVQIDPSVLNMEGGGLHCMVQQQPAIRP